MATDSTCGTFANKTDPLHLGVDYGGIPTTLITNTIFWAVIITAFIFIRQSAFQHVRSLGEDLLSNTERNMNRVIEVGDFQRPRKDGSITATFAGILSVRQCRWTGRRAAGRGPG